MGWKPKYENGYEIPDWKQGLGSSDYLNQKGSEGWELITYAPITSMSGLESYLMVLKRQLP